MKLSFDGLRPLPSQIWGAVRLVPLVRDEVRGDLRLAQRVYPEAALGAVVRGRPERPGLRYYSWVPHSLILRWTDDGQEVALGSSLAEGRGAAPDKRARTQRLLLRMAKAERKRRLRIAPLHLAMEGLLSLHFNGPDVAWREYSERVLRHGLTPRVEWQLSAHGVPDLSDALGLFEIAPGQVGVLVFVGDRLGAAFVTPHPEDYRALHPTLLQDFYGQMLYWYGQHATPPELRLQLDDARVEDLASLRAELARAEQERAAFQAWMASGLVDRELDAERVRRAGPFTLHRFITRLPEAAPDAQEQHVGEVLLREGGGVEYLKTFLLSPSQVRRVRLLKHLAAHDWHLLSAMRAWKGGGRLDLVLKREGLGYLFNPARVTVALQAWRREQAEAAQR